MKGLPNNQQQQQQQQQQIWEGESPWFHDYQDYQPAGAEKHCSRFNHAL